MRILVTAGPTREPLDPVRFISNRSTGRMGYAVARAAAKRGHEVRLVSGPVTLAVPRGAEVLRVVTAADMAAAVQQGVGWCDALVMAAAVADWRPASVSVHKLKKRDMSPVLRLERTADILAGVRSAKGNRVFVGFAAETEDLLAEARRKLEAKGLDLIVANDVSRPDSGFEVDTNRVVLVAPGGDEALPLLSKDEVADRIVGWIEARRGPGDQSMPSG